MASRTVTLAHGSGGESTRDLIEQHFLPHFTDDLLAPLEDQAVLSLPPGRVAFTTDSFVVNPLFFPGGDIGKLAVCGTVNDLAVGGARPLFLSCSFVLEEGLPLEVLDRVAASMARAAVEAEVRIVTGDTKVVNRGAADGMFVTTTGIGIVPEEVSLSARHIRPGDKVVLSGSIGDHGVTLFCLREGIDIAADAESDCAPLGSLAAAVVEAAESGLRAMRDPTRGGLAATIVEMAHSAGVSVELEESAIPVRESVVAACEVLGFDPLVVANEGKLVAFTSPETAEAVVAAMRGHPLGREAAIIGEAVESRDGLVWLNTTIGGRRIVDMPVGELLPRIC